MNRLLATGVASNVLLSAYLIYRLERQDLRVGKIGESVDWGMDRIDECLNRIDLRNNETTGYFEKVSKKVDELERLQQGKKS